MSSSPQPLQRIAADVKLGRNVRIYDFTNLYGCEIGDEVKIGTLVEIQKGAKIGKTVAKYRAIRSFAKASLWRTRCLSATM